MTDSIDDIVLVSKGIMQPRVVDIEYRAILERYEPKIIVKLQEKTVGGDYYTMIGIDNTSYQKNNGNDKN